MLTQELFFSIRYFMFSEFLFILFFSFSIGLKVVHFHVPNQKFTIVMVKESGLSFWLASFFPSNAGVIHTWNNRINTHSHITFTCLYYYFLFLLTWDTCQYVWDSYIYMNCRLSDTCLFLFLQSWIIEIPLLTASLFHPCRFLAIISCRLVMICIRYHVGATCIFAMSWFVLYRLIGK